MIKHIKKAFFSTIELALILISFGSFIFMLPTFYNGFVFAGLFLFALCVLTHAAATWLIENEWRF